MSTSQDSGLPRPDDRRDASAQPEDQIDRLEKKADALDEHIDEARAASEQARPEADLPVGVGDFNNDSADGPGEPGVTPEANYTTRGD